MQYKQIKSKKIYEIVFDELLDMISSGRLKPGDKVDSVQQLAENFNVGRSAIREALSALRVMGLVEMKQGEGTFIKAYSPQALSHAVFNKLLMGEKDIKDLLEVRKILELGAVASAAKNFTDEDLQNMENALELMSQANKNEELGEKADMDFHMAISKASKNQLLQQLMISVSDILTETMRETRRLWLFSKKTTLELLLQEHMDIFHSIKERDGQKAQELLSRHLEGVEQILMEYYIAQKKG